MFNEAIHRNAPSVSAPGGHEQGGLPGWAAGHLPHDFGVSAGAFDPAYVDRVRARAERLFGPGRYFGLTIRGLDEAARAGQVMLVGNHSGGTSIPDAWGFAVGWYQHFGTARPLHVLGHDLLFALPAVARGLERLGVLRASGKVARDVLGRGRDVLVYPGGDIETWRPYSKRYQVDFAGRTGYARVAVEARVPIVPVAHAGSHETLRVLTSGRWFARALGLHRLARAEVWPIHLSLPWGVGFGPLPHLPWPAQFRYLIGAPIEPGADVGALDQRVREAVQEQLNALRQEELDRPKRA